MTGEDGYMGFVGVTTGSSAIMRIFPAWADELALPTRTIVGHDVALDAPPETYRALVEQIRDDPRHFGALVTTHKMSVYSACRNVFDQLDDYAATFDEISSIAKRGRLLTGAAKDPITVRLAYEEFVPPGYFADTGAHALCLGSGGSGAALVHQLAARRDRPARIVVTGLRQSKLDDVRALIERSGLDPTGIEYVRTVDTTDADAVVATLAPGSLVANATGMGKDLPGSPLSDRVLLPKQGIVWDFNYRGTLELLAQARAQAGERDVRAIDGWRYFVHGWSQVIADVFQVEMPVERVDRLSEIANRLR